VDYQKLIDKVIEREGDEYTDRKADRGGPTKYGITQKTLSAWRGVAVPKDAVKNLSREEACQIYEAFYLHRPGYTQITDPNLLELVFDFAVNSGPANANRCLQQCLNKLGKTNLKIDGVMGPLSWSAFNLFADKARLYDHLIDQRVKYLCKLVVDDSTQIVHLNGWINRALSFRH
jgi:lysozyme family protein